MKTDKRTRLLRLYSSLYAALYRLFIARMSPQSAHDEMRRWLRRLDGMPPAVALMRSIRDSLNQERTISVGGVRLDQPLILAAGLVKGDGYDDEAKALRHVDSGRNILPGWRIVPALCGAVEFGSFTRHPRPGNAGTVIWRDNKTRSTQNRMGLPNPGAKAAARFLADRKSQLPSEYGINIAISPGVKSVKQRIVDSVESLDFFLEAGVEPSWFTLNLSCPNTFDDPTQYQFEDEARDVCQALVDRLKQSKCSAPLWVKLSPGLQKRQYDSLVRVCHDVGVKAIVATNTRPEESPSDPNETAGVGGADLRAASLEAVGLLSEAIRHQDAAVDIVACGGIMDGESFRAYQDLGAKAGQYWSALVFRGPLAAALINSEMTNDEHEYEAFRRQSLA